MVEFCTACGTSLPKGDLTVKKGKLSTSPDYVCPSCNKAANPLKEDAPAAEPASNTDLVFKTGQARKE